MTRILCQHSSLSFCKRYVIWVPIISSSWSMVPSSLVSQHFVPIRRNLPPGLTYNPCSVGSFPRTLPIPHLSYIPSTHCPSSFVRVSGSPSSVVWPHPYSFGHSRCFRYWSLWNIWHDSLNLNRTQQPVKIHCPFLRYVKGNCHRRDINTE